jgi:ABC-type transport system involved in multi-copper enzyme maturation permease subunit
MTTARLTAVELRKATDTRAGFWLQVATAGITLAAVVILLIVGERPDRALDQVLALAVQPAGVLLPIVGILLVSSEWSQRTALITFTLVPRRARVLVAKAAAGTLIALAATVASLALSAFGVAVAGGELTLSAGLLGQMTVYTVTAMLIGVGFGAMLQSSAPAIVLSFAAPLAFTALGAIPALEGVAHWVDQSRSLAPLTDELLSATQWAQAGTTLALWLGVPLAIGAWRLVRGEIR